MNPYMKIYNSSQRAKATKDARISIVDGSLIHSHKDGYEDLQITSKVKKFLKVALSAKTTNNMFAGKSTFDAMWIFIENVAKSTGARVANKPEELDIVIEGINRI